MSGAFGPLGTLVVAVSETDLDLDVGLVWWRRQCLHGGEFVADPGGLVVPPVERVRQLLVALDRVKRIGVSTHSFQPPAGRAVGEIADECCQSGDDSDEKWNVILHTSVNCDAAATGNRAAVWALASTDILTGNW